MWAKFGQMAGKAISKIKKPKGLKQKAQAVMSKTKVQAKKIAGKTKNLIKNQYEFTKNYPGLSAATIAGGAVVGSGVGYGINKMRKKIKKKNTKLLILIWVNIATK